MIKITKRLSVLICSIILVAVSSVTFFAQSTYVLADDASIFSQQETTTLSELMQTPPSGQENIPVTLRVYHTFAVIEIPRVA